MLELINAERVKAGVGPVVLGDNVAAQLHAEDALENCFSSHWGMDGLKPYMRYSLAGGYQSNGENGSGIDYCYTPSSGYAAIGPIEQEIREAMDGLMGSAGHRATILKPRYRKVNIGLAWDVHNVRVVQQFEGDHVEYGVIPVIEDDVLMLSGTVKNGVLFLGSKDLSVGVFYDPPPRALTRGQLARTYCAGAGRPVAFLRLPLTGGSYYPEDEFTRIYKPCPDPYEAPADSLPPRSPDEAHDLWQAAYDASQNRAGISVTGQWITADEWHAEDSSFSVKADLSDVLADHGPGVYTIIVWGWQPDTADKMVISEYSIFYGVIPPDTYDPEAFPTVALGQAPAPAQTGTPTAANSSTPTPTATTPSPAPTATSTLDATASPSPIPTATASPTPAAAAFSLSSFRNGRWLEQRDPHLASSIVRLGWTQDGIDGTESQVIQNMLYIAVTSRSVVSSLVSLGWVRDGIDGVEAEAIGWMNNIGSAEVASFIISLDWVQDGIADIESEVIEYLSYVAYRDAEAALRILQMPFIETIEPPDVAAIESLWQLAASEPETFVSVMSHPVLLDGITNDLAPIVATLNGVVRTNPTLIDVLLDPTKVTLELRTITLPLAGDVILCIIRTASGAGRSMDMLEYSVRVAEEFMGVPLPTNYVGLLYENAVYGSNAGTNFGTHIALRPEFDVDDDSYEAEFALSGIAHEVAHYYWSGNEDWVDEGASELMASIIEGGMTDKIVAVTNPPCGHAGTISELESLGISRGDVGFRCNYSLGERLFVDLYQTLGNEIFREGFRALYLASEVEDDADDYPGTSVNIEHVRKAFSSEDGAETAVIARWYDGMEPRDLSRLDTSSVDFILPSINGRIDEAYVITRKNGPAVSSFSARDITDWVYLMLKYSYAVTGSPQEVPLEIVEYYEDGFEFRRRSYSLAAESRYIGGTSWFSIGSPPSGKWATGQYWVLVFEGDRKVAEVQYEVTP